MKQEKSLAIAGVEGCGATILGLTEADGYVVPFLLVYAEVQMSLELYVKATIAFIGEALGVHYEFEAFMHYRAVEHDRLN